MDVGGLSAALIWPSELTSALDLTNFALGRSYGLTDAVSGVVFEALEFLMGLVLVMVDRSWQVASTINVRQYYAGLQYLSIGRLHATPLLVGLQVHAWIA